MKIRTAPSLAALALAILAFTRDLIAAYPILTEIDDGAQIVGHESSGRIGPHPTQQRCMQGGGATMICRLPCLIAPRYLC